nr:IS3 family transposase [Gilliamella apicola]
MFQRHFPKDVLIYSDQGSQYCSAVFKQLLLQYGLRQSISRRGNCFDDAVVESFFHTLKTHIIHGCYYKTRMLANKALFEYIEIYYNRIHCHSANGWISLEQYEQQYYQNDRGGHCLIFWRGSVSLSTTHYKCRLPIINIHCIP